MGRVSDSGHGPRLLLLTPLLTLCRYVQVSLLLRGFYPPQYGYPVAELAEGDPWSAEVAAPVDAAAGGGGVGGAGGRRSLVEMPGVISPGDSRSVGELAALKWEYAEGQPELHTAVKLAMGGILQVTTSR